jgi:hypothetical protein
VAQPTVETGCAHHTGPTEIRCGLPPKVVSIRTASAMCRTLLHDLCSAPEELRPRIEPAQITEQAARHVAEIAQSLRSRGHDNPRP